MMNNICIDLHLDLLYDVARKRAIGKRHVIETDYLPSFIGGGLTAVVSSLYTDQLDDNGLKDVLFQISALYAEIEESNGKISLATCTDEIIEANQKGSFPILLAFEGVEPLSNNVEMLRTFYKLGVRIVGVCWSRSNWAADGSRFFDQQYIGYGLTENGKKLIDMCEELHMIIDVSHTNDKGFWDIMDRTSSPIIATHSDCRAISNTPRNLSDEQITAIGARGGIIGVNGSSLLLDLNRSKEVTMNDLAKHIIHIKDVAGISCPAIGLDQCDKISSALADEISDNHDVIPDHRILKSFKAVLSEAGLSSHDIDCVYGENVFRVLRQVIG